MAILRKRVTPSIVRKQGNMLVVRKSIKQTVWVFCQFIGLRAIWHMFSPPTVQQSTTSNYRKPSTLFLTVLGLYLALYGVAFGVYQHRVTQLSNQLNLLALQMSIPEARLAAFSQIENIQYAKCPNEPRLLKPTSVFAALVYDPAPIDLTNKSFLKSLGDSFIPMFTPSNLELAEQLRDIASTYKKHMGHASLAYCYFTEADFSGAIFIKSKLTGTQFQHSDLSTANLTNANMTYANLRLTKLTDTTFSNTNLRHASLSQSDIRGTNFENAILSFADLTSTTFDNKTNFKGAILIGANLLNASSTPKSSMHRQRTVNYRHFLSTSLPPADLLRSTPTHPKLYKLLLSCATLYKARLDRYTRKKILEIKPALLQKPNQLPVEDEALLEQVTLLDKVQKQYQNAANKS